MKKKKNGEKYYVGQTIQDGLYSIPVKLDKFICRSLGATTIKDLVKNKEISGLTIKECEGIKANKPDVLVNCWIVFRNTRKNVASFFILIKILKQYLDSLED